jgi:O-acetyl-ADP-ribose deacetylase (regulator of RNase III)
MAIEYIKKDITETTVGIIAHGVNCQGAMGSGVALAIMTKWPIIRESYMRIAPGKQNLGNVDFVDVDPFGLLPKRYDPERSASGIVDPLGRDLVVANCFTQEFYGSGGRKYADPDAVAKCLDNVYAYADVFCLPVVMPQIGCGLAGLYWEADLVPIINQCDERYSRVDTTICLWG